MNKPTMLARAACAALFLAGTVFLAGPAQAQDCTFSPWSSSTGLTDSDVGTPNEGISRFSGFCGLQVPLDGAARYLTDNSPFSEASYNLRFHARVSGTSSPVRVFVANDSDDAVISVWANRPAPGSWQLRLATTTGGVETLSIPVSETLWHDVRVMWESDPSAEIEFSVDGPFVNATIDTIALAIDDVQLGNIDAVAGGGTIAFDSFASRRVSYPDFLPAGDADGDGVYTGADQIAIYRERLDDQLASGQPDCDRDGDVDQQDSECLRAERFGELAFPVTTVGSTSSGGPIETIFDNGFEPVQ